MKKSGIWQDARDVASDKTKLKKIASRAIKIALQDQQEEFEIRRADLVVKKLKFIETRNSAIDIDAIEFDLIRDGQRDVVHITKGLKSTCVFHVKQTDVYDDRLHLAQQWCGEYYLYL